MRLRKGRKYDAQRRVRGSFATLFVRGRDHDGDMVWRAPMAFTGVDLFEGEPPRATPVLDRNADALDAYSSAVVDAVEKIGSSVVRIHPTHGGRQG